MSKAYNEALKRLIEERKRCNLTQKDICTRIGMTQSHYSKAEAGLKRFSLGTLKCMSELGFDLYYIFTGKKIRPAESILSEMDEARQLLFLENLYSLIEYESRNRSGKGWQKLYDSTKCMKYILCMKLAGNRSLFYLLREYTGYSQREMAVLLGMDVKKYASIESGKAAPDSEIIFLLYDAFGISPYLVMGYEDMALYEILSILDRCDRELYGRVLRYYNLLNEALLQKETE
jgi:transcriptional regulator with XRE-family HTH domain